MASLDKEILSVKDITRLLEDRAFADYFNVFLSLPVSFYMSFFVFNVNVLFHNVITLIFPIWITVTYLGLCIHLVFFQIFSQKLLFKFNKKSFEFDPPLPTKTNVVGKISELFYSIMIFTNIINHQTE